ncbi:TPA: hypothetical protein ACRUFK_004013 [Aeromonas hydrophila]
MKYINWDQASKLGLIVRINRETLHPLGLAMIHNQENGASEMLMVSTDGIWEYAQQLMANVPTDSQGGSTGKNCRVDEEAEDMRYPRQNPAPGDMLTRFGTTRAVKAIK